VSNQLVKNAALMYGRMLILMVINLYISRIVLNYLGPEKFGLMSVISGVVVIGTFLANVLEVTAQRYISESLSKENINDAVMTIQSLSYIYIIVVVGSIVIVELFGLYYINTFLNQDVLEVKELNLIFQMSVLIYFLSSMSSIFLSILIAFENVKYYSIVTLLEVFVKLFLVTFLNSFNSNIFYYLLILLISILVSRVYAYSYIKKTKPEISIKPLKNKLLLKKISYFVKWNLIGGFSSILTVQGLNVVVNVFQGLTVNAARAIATQLNLAILQMINSIQLAFNPKIVKLYINGDGKELNKIFLINAKLTAAFSALIIIVFNFKLNEVLVFWLGDYPDVLNSFIYCMFIEMYFASFSGPLLSIVQASEKIKLYQIVIGGTMFLNVPICYAVLTMHNDPLVIYYVPIFINLLCFFQRMYFVNKLKLVNLKQYVIDVFLKVTLFLIVALFFQKKIENVSMGYNILIQLLGIFPIMFFVALTSNERKYVLKNLKFLFRKYV